MQKLTKYVKTDFWMSQDGTEFTNEKDCQEHNKTQKVLKLVEGLQKLNFWSNYNIPNYKFEGKVIENLRFHEVVFAIKKRSFLLRSGKDNDLWVKVSLQDGDKIVLMLYPTYLSEQPQDWKFLGQFYLSDVDSTTKAHYFNTGRNAKLLRKWEQKNILIRSGLSKLTEDEKKALKLI